MNAMKRIALTLLSILSALSLVTNAKAVTCYALTDTAHLLSFDSTSPGSVTDKGAISGLGGYTLVGLDIRTTTQTTSAANPGLGSVWTIGYSGALFQLFVITPSTPPTAAPIGAPLVGINNSASANGWGFGFDPARDRIRFIGVQYNYLIDPNTATYQHDTDFAGFPAFSGAAYTTSSFGGTSQFYNIDRGTSPDRLQTSGDVSAGSVSVVGTNLGFDFSPPAALDIFQNTSLLASNGTLYSVNLSTGVASMVGAISGAPSIRGLAIVPTTFPPVLSVTVKISGKKKITTTATSLKIKGTASCEAGITVVQYKIGKGKFKNAKGTTSWNFKAKLKPGVNKITVVATGGNAVQSAPAKIKVTVTQ